MLARSQIVLPDVTIARTWACSAGLTLVNVVPVFAVKGCWRAFFSSSWNCPPVLAQVSFWSDEPPPELPPTPQAEIARAPTVIKVKKRIVFIVGPYSRSFSIILDR